MIEQLAEKLGVERELLENLVVMMAKACEAAERAQPNVNAAADLMETGVLTVLKVYEASRRRSLSMTSNTERRGGIMGILSGAASGGIVGFLLGVLVGAWFW